MVPLTLKELEDEAKRLCGVTRRRGRPDRERTKKRATPKFCAARCFALEGDLVALKGIVAEVQQGLLVYC